MVSSEEGMGRLANHLIHGLVGKDLFEVAEDVQVGILSAEPRDNGVGCDVGRAVFSDEGHGLVVVFVEGKAVGPEGLGLYL